MNFVVLIRHFWTELSLKIYRDIYIRTEIAPHYRKYALIMLIFWVINNLVDL